jgi:PAS domain S-box-containing protein
MPQNDVERRKGALMVSIVLVLTATVSCGAVAGYHSFHGDRERLLSVLILVSLVPLASYVLYKRMILPFYRRLEDANLELRLKQEELLDTKDDLFIKFLGVYDVNYAANSPRLFARRLKDVADITAKVMEADACFIYLYDKNKEELTLAATNGPQEAAIGGVRVLLGEGIEGWVGRKLEPLMLKDCHADARFREIPGLDLSEYLSVYCLPLYVYSNGALVGVMEVFYRKARSFNDEEINFFTTLSGIISTTVQNEQLQIELRKMNMELEQWVAEKTEELRASEERYRTLVENASEAIFVLAENGDIVFANEQAAALTGYAKYDLLHNNLPELLEDPRPALELVAKAAESRQVLSPACLRKSDGTFVPVEVSVVGLTLMGKRFVQSVARDVSSQARLEKLIEEKDRELSILRAGPDPEQSASS